MWARASTPRADSGTGADGRPPAMFPNQDAFPGRKRSYNQSSICPRSIA